jgi:alkylhydroperoxidase family enzyme
MGAAISIDDAGWGECVVPAVPVDAGLAETVRRRVGASPDWLTRTAPLPWLVDALCAFIGKPFAYVPPELADLIGLVVSQDNSCRYCYGIQRTILRILGHPDERVDQLLRDVHLADVSPAERAALDFARRVSRANPLPGRAEFAQVVAAGLSPLAVTEVAAIAAVGNFMNRVATLLALPPDSLEAASRTRMFRVMRPLIAWRMRPRRKHPVPPPVPNDGPCARLVAALGDSPAASALRAIIDSAWASGVLPRRTKTLMLAVIARAMGCGYGEQEARGFLRDDGVSARDVDEVLSALDSPCLDARERRLIPFARETVRYQTATIQARFRDVCRDFTPAEILETAGIVGLANGACRLSVVLDAC